MRFHSPLDDVQWKAAVQLHAQMRINLQRLRKQFAPHTREQRSALRGYRDAIQDFGRELLKARDSMDAEVLNELQARVGLRYVNYVETRLS